MKTLMVTFFVLAGIFSVPSVHADEHEANAENVCHINKELLETPMSVDDILQSLFVNFSEQDSKGRKLAFKSKPIKLEAGAITFNDPRFNGRVINFNESNCAQTKKNIFGYEICQEMASKEIAASLCAQLGLGEAIRSESEVVKSTKEAFNYMYSEGKWESLRMYSALAPPIKFIRLKSITCSTQYN